MCNNRVRIEWDKIDAAVNDINEGKYQRSDVLTMGKKVKVYSCGSKVIRIDIPVDMTKKEE